MVDKLSENISISELRCKTSKALVKRVFIAGLFYLGSKFEHMLT